MIIYNVTVNIDLDVETQWVKWMKEVHIPEVMATGLFLESRMMRVLANDEGGTSYAIQYSVADMAHFESYQRDHAPRLQAETEKFYDGKFAAFRTLLEVVHPL